MKPQYIQNSDHPFTCHDHLTYSPTRSGVINFPSRDISPATYNLLKLKIANRIDT